MMDSPRHLTCVIYRRRIVDLFRKTYWVRCWKCESLYLGPFWDRGIASDVCSDFMDIGNYDRLWCDARR
jgi:hypothetical protein